MEQVKGQLTKELFMEEEKRPGSRSLSAGSCHICGEDNCSKPLGRALQISREDALFHRIPGR